MASVFKSLGYVTVGKNAGPPGHHSFIHTSVDSNVEKVCDPVVTSAHYVTAKGSSTALR